MRFRGPIGPAGLSLQGARREQTKTSPPRPPAALEDPLQGNARAKEELQRQIVTNYNAFMANGPPPGYFGGPPGFGRRDGPPRGGFGGRGPPMGFR